MISVLSALIFHLKSARPHILVTIALALIRVLLDPTRLSNPPVSASVTHSLATKRIARVRTARDGANGSTPVRRWSPSRQKCPIPHARTVWPPATQFQDKVAAQLIPTAFVTAIAKGLQRTRSIAVFLATCSNMTLLQDAALRAARGLMTGRTNSTLRKWNATVISRFVGTMAKSFQVVVEVVGVEEEVKVKV